MSPSLHSGAVDRTFLVGYYHGRSHYSAFGRLSIGPGLLTLDAWPIARRVFTHHRGTVTAVHARLLPPPWRHTFVLSFGRSWYGFDSGLAGSGAVRQAIEHAGFPIRDRATRLVRFPAPPLH